MAIGTRQRHVEKEFWLDKKVCALFCSDDPECMLRDCIVQLQDAEVNIEKLAQLVNLSESFSLSTQQLFSIQRKVLYLRCAYRLALSDMSCEETWQACCDRAISMLANAGITTISNERTLCRWSSYFLVNKWFPHLNFYIELGKEFQPKLFEYFPEARDKLKNWMNNNLEILSTERATSYIREELVPEFYEVFKQENAGSTATKLDFFSFLKVKTIDPSTMWRWMQRMGFCYDRQRKTFYNDKHENVENRQARKSFIN